MTEIAVFAADLKHQVFILQQVSIAFLTITTVSVALRFYVRIRLLGYFGLDDWMMLMAQLCFVLVVGVTFYLVHMLGALLGSLLGESNDALDLKLLSVLIKIATGFYIPAMTFFKLSLGFFFLKIFTVHRWQRWLVYSIMGTALVWGIVVFFMTVCGCALTAAFFGTESSCEIYSAWSAIQVSWSVYNTISDFAFCGLSVMALWPAKLPLSAKIPATALLIFGTVGGIAGLVRLTILFEPNMDSFLQIVGRLKSSWWTVVEAGVGISAASLATLRPLFKSCFERAKSASRYGTANKSGGANSDDRSNSQSHRVGLVSKTSVVVRSQPASKVLGDHYGADDDVEAIWSGGRSQGLGLTVDIVGGKDVMLDDMRHNKVTIVEKEDV